MKKFLLSLLGIITCICAQATDYKLVTSESELEVGANYIIVGGSYYTLSATAGTNNFPQQEIPAPKDNVITTIGTEAISVITLENSLDSSYPYKLKVSDGYLYAASTSNNHLKVTSDPGTNATASIEIATSGSAATIKFNNRNNSGSIVRNIIRYNSGSSLFSCYSSGQQPVYLYKEVAPSGDGKITTTLSFPQESYTANLGETFSTPTLTGAPEAATISWTSSETSVATIDAKSGAITIGETAGSTIITATYAGDDTHTSATASFTLEVTDPNDKSVTDEVTSACLSDKNNGSYAIYTYNSTTGAVYTTRAIIENNTFRLNKATETYFCVSTAPANYKLSKIVLHKTKGSNAVKIYASTTAYTTQGNNPPGGSLIRTTETAIGDYTIDFTNDSDPSNKPLKETNYVAFYVVGPGGVTNFSSIDVTWEPTTSEGEIKKDPALSFDASVCYATLGEDFVEPTLSTATGVTCVEYSSSDSEIASVNAKTGEVTPIKVGNVTITAKKEADETFDGQEVSYELNVLAAETYLSTDDMSNRSDLTNNTAITDQNIAVGDAVIFFDGTGASSKSKYFAGEGIRFYADNSLIVTAPEGKYLTKITFVGVNNNPVSNFTPTYGKIDTDNDCWLCNGEAQNSVTISTAVQVRFKGIIIEYSKYKLAHGESTSDSEVTFLENTNSNNNLQLYGTFTKSTSLTVDSYVIRVNGVEATTIAGTADDFTLTGLPYIKDATFTIAPVVDGVELPQEALGIQMPELPVLDFTSKKMELFFDSEAYKNASTCNLDAWVFLTVDMKDATTKESLGEADPRRNLTFSFEEFDKSQEGVEIYGWYTPYKEVQWCKYKYFTNVPVENELPVTADVIHDQVISLSFNAYFTFNVTPELASLLPSATRMEAPARAGEAEVIQTVAQTAPLKFMGKWPESLDSVVSGVEGVTVDGAAVEYFNLQGVRVDGDLAPGIYIRRQGQSVSKVQIR